MGNSLLVSKEGSKIGTVVDLYKYRNQKLTTAEQVREWVKHSTIAPNRFKTPHFRGKIITSERELAKLARKMMKLDEFAFDVETTGFRVKQPGCDRIVGMSISWGKENTYYIPIYHVEYLDRCFSEKLITKYFKKVFEREDVVIVAHNGMFDVHVLANMNIFMRTLHYYDTMIAVWMINENLLKNLEETVKHYYGYNKFHFKDVISTIPGELKKEYGYKANQNVPCSLCEIEILGLYNMDDTYWAWKLYLDTPDAIAEDGMENHFYNRYPKFFYTVYNMERRGVKIDIEKLKDMQERARIALEEMEYEIYELAGIEFNVSSDQQVQELLFGYEKYLPVYEEVKEYEFDAQGNPVYYKSGKNKGEQKFKVKNNKDNVVGQRFSGNRHILDMSFDFPITHKTDGGAPQTNKDALNTILDKTYKKDKHKQDGQKLVKLLLRYSKLSTRKGTFMDGMLTQIYPDGKIHTNYGVVGTDSGRLSSSDPNLMNLPRVTEKVEKPEKEAFFSSEAYLKALDEYNEYIFFMTFDVRECFVPDSEDEVIQVHDYTNLEAMLQAEYSEDPLLIEMFAEKYDMHGYTATRMFNLECHPNECKKKYPKLRQISKNIRFALQYGGTEFAISRNTGMTKEEAREKLDDYYETFKGEARYKVKQIKFAHKYGFVYSLLGRKRHLEGINSENRKISGYFERVSLNYPNQAGAFDVIMEAQIRIEDNKRLKELKYRQILQVHDEVIGVVPKKNVEESIQIVKGIMETCVKLKHVSLIADGDYSSVCYAEAK